MVRLLRCCAVRTPKTLGAALGGGLTGSASGGVRRRTSPELVPLLRPRASSRARADVGRHMADVVVVGLGPGCGPGSPSLNSPRRCRRSPAPTTIRPAEDDGALRGSGSAAPVTRSAAGPGLGQDGRPRGGHRAESPSRGRNVAAALSVRHVSAPRIASATATPLPLVAALSPSSRTSPPSGPAVPRVELNVSRRGARCAVCRWPA